MKEVWLMICGEYGILDKCMASSRDEASRIFAIRNSYENWSESDFISEADYLIDKQSKNSFNSQGLRYVSPEVGWVDQDEEHY